MRTIVRSTAVAALFALLALPGTAAAKQHDPFDRTIGSLFGGGPTLGLCPVLPPATVRRCTLSFTDRASEEDIFGKFPHVPGHVVRFRLEDGTPTADTTAVSVRFRALGGPLGPGGPASRWFALPLVNPHPKFGKLRGFPALVPFLPGDRLALDVVVHGNGRGEAAAPLAEASSPPENTAEWSPPLGTAKGRPLIRTDRALQLNAVFERDDQVAPVLRWTYAPRQNFLRTRRVYVRVHGSERGQLNPEAVLVTGDTGWGLLANAPHFRPGGGWATYFCELGGPALPAARRAFRAGKDVHVRIRLRAWDPANNGVSAKTFFVRPTRP